MKIAVSGKGGVGKTTISGALARFFAKKRFKVLAIDADPNSNLAFSLGISPLKAEGIIPISDNADLIEKKTGVKPETYGSVFRLSFRVDDILENFSIRSPENIGLLVMGTVKSPGQGCTCPANAVVRALLRYLLTRRDEVVIVDMEAGTEHLGRGTAKSVDAMLIVSEPSLKALETVKRIYNLTKEMGVPRIFIVGNKVTDQNDVETIVRFCETNEFPLLDLLPYDNIIRKADIDGTLIGFDSPMMKKIRNIGEKLLNLT